MGKLIQVTPASILCVTDREKDVEILALRHQLTILQRQLGDQRPQLRPDEDRAFLAALLTPLARATLCRLQLLVSPDTVLRWHRDVVKRRHALASRRRRPGRPRTVASVRRLVLRLAAENSSWGYRRIHGELALLGVTVAASTVWEILKAAGVDPAPHRATVTWVGFLRSQTEAVLAMDFIETGIATVLTGVRVPRMNAIMERWVKTLRGELLDCTLIWNGTHLRHALLEYEQHYNLHRTHRSLAAAAPLRAQPEPLGLDRIERLAIRRQDRLGGVLHEYRHAAWPVRT